MAIGDLIGSARIGIEPDMSPFKKAGMAFAAAGTAAGALVMSGITKALDQADVTTKLSAQLGTTGDVAEKQGKIAGKLYSTGVSENFQAAADAIKATVQAGLAPPDATNKQLESIATKAQDVATVFDQDVKSVTNQVSQLMRNGLAKNADEAFDIITKGFQVGADKADDFLDVIEEYGTQFRKAGFTGQQAIGLINQGLKAGARDADIVADAIKEFSIRAVDGSKLTAQGFKDLGLNADDMAAKFAKGGSTANAVLDLTLDKLRGIKDPVKQSQIAVSLFGTQAEDLGKALFALDPSTATKKLGDFAGAADELGKKLRSGPRHEIEVFKRTIEQKFIGFLGGKVIPAIHDLASGLAGKTDVKFTLSGHEILPKENRFRSFGLELRKSALSIGKLFEPVAKAVGGVAKSFGRMVANTPAGTLKKIADVLIATALTTLVLKLAAAFRALALALALTSISARPVAFLALAVVGLVSAIGMMSGKTDGVTSSILYFGQAIAYGAEGTWKLILAIGRFLGGKDAVGEAVGNFFIWLGKKIVDGIVAGAKGVWKALKWLGSQIKQTLWDHLLEVFGISSPAKSMFPIGRNIILGILHGAQDLLSGILPWLRNHLVEPVLGFFKNAGKWLYDTGWKLISGLKSGIVGGTKRIGRWLKEHIVDPVVRSVKGWFGVKSPSTVFSGIGGSLLTGLKNGIVNGARGIGGWLGRNLISPITSRFKGATGWLVGKGKDITKGLLKGMRDWLGGITGWVKRNIFDKIVGAVKAVFGIKSPSTEFARLGGHMIAGLMRGLLSGRKALSSVVRKVFGSPLAAIKALISKGVSLGGSLFGGKVSGKITGSNQQIGHQLMLSRWSEAHWPALRALWMGESGWNARAHNPSSGAHGIPQALPASKMRSHGADYWTNPVTQIRWGLDYIAQRYGSPINAYNFWLRQRPHWYDQGGWLMPGLTLAMNATGRPERILGPGEGVGGAITINQLHLHVHGPVGSQYELESWLASALTHLKQQGRLRGLTQAS